MASKVIWDDETPEPTAVVKAQSGSNVVWDDEAPVQSGVTPPAVGSRLSDSARNVVPQAVDTVSSIPGTAAKVAFEVGAEPWRLGRELVGGISRTAQKAVHGLTTTPAAFLGTLASGRSVNDAFKEAGAAREDFDRRMAAQDEVFKTDPSYVSRGLGAVIAPAIDAAERVTGDTGFARAGLEAAGDIATIYGVGKGTAPLAKKILRDTESLPGAEGAVGRAVASGIDKTKESLVGRTLRGGVTPQGVVPVAKNVAREAAIAERKLRPVNTRLERDLLNFAKPTKGDKIAKPKDRRRFVEEGYTAGKEIADEAEKGNLSFFDKDGYEVKTRPPETIAEMVEANEALLQKHGQAIGKLTEIEGKIDLSPIVPRLEAYIADRVNRVTAKGAITFAQEILDDIKKNPTVSPAQMQDFIAKFNAIKYGKVVDPMRPGSNLVASDVAGAYTEMLDNYISSLGDEGVLAAAKARYRAQRTIQDGLNHKYAQIMSKSTHTPLSMWEGGALYQFATGAATGNLTQLAQAGILKGVDVWNRMARNPNNAVKEYFKNVKRRTDLEKRLPPAPVVPPPPAVQNMPPKPAMTTVDGVPVRADQAGPIGRPTNMNTQPYRPAPLSESTQSGPGIAPPMGAKGGQPYRPAPLSESAALGPGVAPVGGVKGGQPYRPKMYFDDTVGAWVPVKQ